MKTFELTQEQINQLAEKKHAKKLLQEFIPEAFNTEPVKGNWYISQYYLIYYLGNSRCHCIKLSDGKWLENIYHSLTGHLKNYRSATEEEIKVALIREAKKRGYKEGVKCKFGIIEDIRTLETNDFEFKLEYNTLGIKRKNGNADIIFRSGKWAEIIEETEPTKEEINRVLTFLKNQNEQ